MCGDGVVHLKEQQSFQAKCCNVLKVWNIEHKEDEEIFSFPIRGSALRGAATEAFVFHASAVVVRWLVQQCGWLSTSFSGIVLWRMVSALIRRRRVPICITVAVQMLNF